MDDFNFSQPPDSGEAQSNPELNDILTRMLAASGGQTGPQDPASPPLNPLAALQAPQNDPIRDFVDRETPQTPHDSLLKLLHMTPEEKSKRSKWGNAGVTAGNVLMSLLGANPRAMANDDYDRTTKRLSLASNEIRNQDLNTRAEKALEQAGKYKDLADQNAKEKLRVAQELADTKQYIADTGAKKESDDAEYKKGLLDINKLSQQAKAGDMTAKQKLADKIFEWKKKHPGGNAAAILANAMTADGSDLDVDTFVKHLGDLKDVTTSPIPNKQTNLQFDSNGVPTGENTVIQGISRGQLRSGAPIEINKTFQTNPDGSFTGNKEMGAKVANQSQIKETSYRTAQNLLQDFGTGAINKYTGIFKGGDFLKMARSQFEKAHGGTSTGEAFDQMMTPQKVIENIRSMTNRMNKSEYDAFSKTMGDEKQGGEALVRRALIYHLTQDDKFMRLHPGTAANLQITDKDGQKINIEDTPEFLQEFRNAVDGAITKAKAARGVVPIKAPSINDVLQATKKRLGSPERIDGLKKQIAATLVDDPEKVRMRQELGLQ